MNEYLVDAKEELKRVDHLVYVSLKYTRTVDVIRCVLQRIISSYDCFIVALAEHAKDKKLIEDVPTTPGLKCDVLEKVFKDNEQIKEHLRFYLLLRKIMRLEYQKSREFRRHVTMTVKVDDALLEVNIDLLTEYYDKTKEFAGLVEELISS